MKRFIHISRRIIAEWRDIDDGNYQQLSIFDTLRGIAFNFMKIGPHVRNFQISWIPIYLMTPSDDPRVLSSLDNIKNRQLEQINV